MQSLVGCSLRSLRRLNGSAIRGEGLVIGQVIVP